MLCSRVIGLKGALVTMNGTQRRRRLRRTFTTWLDEELEARRREWREQSTAVEAAYARWSQARGEERLLAFEAYRAALDLEEEASHVYADRVARVQRELEWRGQWLAAQEPEAQAVV